MEKQKNIPQLRFPEFKGEWEKVKLGDVAENISSGKSKIRNSEGGFPLYGSTGIIGYSDNYEYSGKNILIARVGANAGSLYKVDGYYSVTDNTLILNLLNKVIADYIYYFLTEINLNRLIFGSGQPLITGGQLKKLILTYPILPEQQKIACFFTAIDQKIIQLRKKKDLLEEYKKGVMQKIFLQKIRFKDDNGQLFTKWEKSKFSQIYSFRVTNSFSRDDLKYEEGEIKNIHYGDIHTKFQTLFDVTKEDVPFINPDISIKRISPDNYCKTSDMVFADASEDLADVGKSIELVNLNNEKVLAGLHTILARPDISKIASGFGGYLMKSIDVRKQIMKIAQGSKITSISSTRLCDIDLNIPCPAEQTKIANFLSAIDDKINHTHMQIEKAEVWKKGLLQQMFV